MKKTLRIVGIVVVSLLLFVAIITSATSKVPNSERVWDEAMTIGNIDAKNYFIIYSDIACTYCIAFENAIIENQENFEDYITENDILVEVRVSDFLYEYGQHAPTSSRLSSLGAYCAKNEGKFWDYYNLAVSEIWNNYYKELGKSAVSKLSDLNEDYWVELGKKVGLGETFESCVENKESLDEIKENAKKSAKLINGMPYFKFNNYISSGFDLSWGYDYVLMYFESGLNS